MDIDEWVRWAVAEFKTLGANLGKEEALRQIRQHLEDQIGTGAHIEIIMQRAFGSMR